MASMALQFFLETPVQDTVSRAGGDWRSDPVPTVMLNWVNYDLGEHSPDTIVVNASSESLSSRDYEVLMLALTRVRITRTVAGAVTRILPHDINVEPHGAYQNSRTRYLPSSIMGWFTVVQ